MIPCSDHVLSHLQSFGEHSFTVACEVDFLVRQLAKCLAKSRQAQVDVLGLLLKFAVPCCSSLLRFLTPCSICLAVSKINDCADHYGERADIMSAVQRPLQGVAA